MFQTELGDKSIPFTDPRRCIYLALSGGGFRATAFHTGVILAYLAYNQHQSLTVVNGVSGGSIAAAHFGTWSNNWREAEVPKSGIEALRDFASPLIHALRLGVRWGIFTSALTTWFRGPPFPVDIEYETRLVGRAVSFYNLKPSALECVLEQHLFHGKTFFEIIPTILFVFSATDLFTGRPFYITSSGSGLRPHRFYDFPTESRHARIARGVCASAAFPLFLRPVEWHLRETEAEEYRECIKAEQRSLFSNQPFG